MNSEFLSSLITFHLDHKDAIDTIGWIIAVLVGAGSFYKWILPFVNEVTHRINLQNLFTSGVPLVISDHECYWETITKDKNSTTQVHIGIHCSNQTKDDLKFVRLIFCKRLPTSYGLSFVASNGQLFSFNNNWIRPKETVRLQLDLFFNPPLNPENGHLLEGQLVLWDQFNKRHLIKIGCRSLKFFRGED